MRGMAKTATAATVVIVTLATACAEAGTDRAPETTTRDSAGISIVESAGPSAPAGSWMIDPSPMLQIGEVDGEDPYVFGRVWGATELSDGRLVIVDELAIEIRIFAPDGSHECTMGGPGEGPAEFGGPPFVAETDDGLLVAWDGGRTRLTWFSVCGPLVDEADLSAALQSLQVTGFRNGQVWEVGADGAVVSTGPMRPPRGDGIRERTKRIALFADRGELATDFGVFSTGQSYAVRLERMSIGIGNPFAPSASAAYMGEGRVAIADTEPWEVKVRNADGSLHRILRAAIPRLEVTAEMEQQGLDQAVERTESSPITRQQAEEAYRALSLPDSVPAIASLHADGAGLWVGRRVGRFFETGEYDVFDAEGRWVTTLSLPGENAELLEIGPDYVLLRAIDELEIQYVRRHTLRRSN